MKRRCTLTLISTAFVWLWIAFPVSNAVAQSAADVEGVKEASKNFYAALAVLDNGEAMEKVWAHTPYVTYVGPRHTSVLVGWDAQEKYWPEANALFTQRSATLSDQHIHVSVLTGCSVATDTPTFAPVTGSHSAWDRPARRKSAVRLRAVVRASAPRVLSVRAAFRALSESMTIRLRR